MTERYILKDGFAVQCQDLMEWGAWMEAHRNKFQKISKVAGLRLSTVFLGLDHSFGHGEPLLWETMLFNDDMNGESESQWRFTFQGEAYEFHETKVKQLKAMLNYWPINLASSPTTPGSTPTD